MELTAIGMVQIVFGLMIVLFGSSNSAFLFLMFSSLLEGSAAILLPALGGSSIPPAQFALVFVLLRIAAPRGGTYGHFPDAIRANAWLLLFCFYGIAMAIIGPRLFGGRISVYPMRPILNAGVFEVFPLAPTTQNLTAGSYMLGTILVALAAYVLARSKGGAALVSATIWGGWFFIVSGVLDLVGRGTPLEDALAIFRNGDYVQMSVEVDGFVRIRGFMPEASTYAGACFVFLVASVELWYRNVRPGQTGLLAIALVAILVMSTSSTAYVSIAFYVTFFLFRALAIPILVPRGKMKRLLAVLLTGAVFVAIAMMLVPQVLEAISNLILSMTVGKSTSFSGQQRLFWAMQGVQAFWSSYGLGIGPGSFRSSSMATAILGSMGVIGVGSFLLYLRAVLQPSRRSTWGLGQDIDQTLGGAFACTAVFSLIPALVGSPQANPATAFSVFAGAALALRAAQQARPTRDRFRRSAAPGAAASAAHSA